MSNVTDNLTIQVPLSYAFFLQQEQAIDNLLSFSPWVSPALEVDVLAAIQLMVPVGCSRELIRIGGDGDGAYLLPNDLQGLAACFSPGVADVSTFEAELADRFGIPSYLCDASVTGENLGLRDDAHWFSRKWLGSFDGAETQSLDHWVLGSDHSEAGDLLLQMDIEGSEYRSLLGCSESVLSRFRIVVLELHGLAGLQSSRFLNTLFLPTLHKLHRQFDCVHAHANNCCGSVDLFGIAVPQVIELTFYRREANCGERRPAKMPHPLDVVNVPNKPPLLLGFPWAGSEVLH
jgi:hypothetical protein